ncbi:hypothetical protein PENANT_c031G04713 [Penicillium antarcticum]|uniref:Uncharacterized protein n=2 Tax=Penicillium antarcticum TaxID=416450 RepID=A0A1V6PV74_9EURO|nr:hypothetical protein PENANT_c031G04713 [Penicillium antarcticum]
MAEIGSGRYRVWLQVTEGDIRWTRPAVFNAQEVESSFREWIDQLTPRHYLEMPDSDEGNNDMELWFNKMIHADSSSVDAVT